MRKQTRRLLLAVFTIVCAIGLSLPVGPPVNATATTEFCEKCEADCYAHAENVRDYNACVLLCNYAANCGIPIIQ